MICYKSKLSNIKNIINTQRLLKYLILFINTFTCQNTITIFYIYINPRKLILEIILPSYNKKGLEKHFNKKIFIFLKNAMHQKHIQTLGSLAYSDNYLKLDLTGKGRERDRLGYE
jgi:uncharacterized protein YlbG (UPF0298 family)